MPSGKPSAALAAELTTQQVASRIHTLRGLQVLFDRDLALFFDVKPIRLREQVKRNANRFPEDFMFQLTGDEAGEMVSQNAIPSKQQLGGSLPYAFTEEGVAALTAVLRSERAVEVGIQIVRAFVAMRKFILNHARIFERLDHVERRQILADQKFEQIFTALESHDAQPRSQGVFFNGQIFDAYTFATSLFKQARKSIVLVDNYVDESVLLMLAKRAPSVTATIYTKKNQQPVRFGYSKAQLPVSTRGGADHCSFSRPLSHPRRPDPLPHRRIPQRPRQAMLRLLPHGFSGSRNPPQTPS